MEKNSQVAQTHFFAVDGAQPKQKLAEICGWMDGWGGNLLWDQEDFDCFLMNIYVTSNDFLPNQASEIFSMVI